MKKVEIGRCRDCKWWVREHYHINKNGKCLIMAQPEETLITVKPDFGCIHWEEKDDDS